MAQADIVYTDLDGTLLGPGGSILRDPSGGWTLEPARALLSALEAGIDVVPVSGRNKVQLLDDVRMLGLRDFIAEAGCLVAHDRLQQVWRCLGDFPEVEGTVSDSIVEFGADGLLFETFPGKLEYHTPWTGNRECSLLLRGNVDLAVANDALSAVPLPLKLIDNGIIHPAHYTLVGVDEIHAYHLLPAAASKPGAVRKDLELRGASRGRAIALGDSLSDLEVAEEVSVFFLVANAMEDEGLARAAAEYDNVYVTSGKMGIGWSEAVHSLVASKDSPTKK